MVTLFCVTINNTGGVMETEYLSQRAFASLSEVGVSHVRINKLIKEGRLPTENGKIPKKAGLEAWKNCRQIGFESQAKGGKKYGGPKNQKKKEPVNEDDFDFEDDGSEDPTDPKWTPRLNKARALVQEQLAIKRKFENEVEQGKYVLKSDVRQEASEVATEVKQKLISIAPIIAVTAEGKTAIQIQKIVEKHINEALTMLQPLEQ